MTNLNNITYNHSLKMPLSTGTVCTPYDSRMIEKRAELHSRIVSRTKRQLKVRRKIYSTVQPVETPKYIMIMASVVFPAFLAAAMLSPLFINFPTL